MWIIRELAERIHPGDKAKYYYGDMDPNQVVEEVIKLTFEKGNFELQGLTLEDLKKGPVKFKHANPGRKRIAFYEQIHDRVPFPPQSYPTPLATTAQFVKSGRMEFYKDEDMFIKLESACRYTNRRLKRQNTRWIRQPEKGLNSTM